jgi:hypothetical protein
LLSEVLKRGLQTSLGLSDFGQARFYSRSDPLLLLQGRQGEGYGRKAGCSEVLNPYATRNFGETSGQRVVSKER